MSEATDNSEFISSPKSEFVDRSRSQALDVPHKRSSEDDEISWARAHSQGRADNVGQNMMVLWNFDVAKSSVKDEHKNAIKKWLAIPMLMTPKFSDLSFNIVGYASSSGSAEENLKLSKERAGAISSYIKELGFLKVTTDGKGALDSKDREAGGETMAKNRRVEISWTGTMPKAGPDAAPHLGTGNPESYNNWTESPTSSNYPDGVGFDHNIHDLTVGPVDFGDMSISMNITGTMKIRIKSPGAKNVVLATLNQDPAMSSVFEKKISDELMARFTMSPPSPSNKNSGVVRATLKLEGTPLKPEIGVQTRERFVFIKFTLYQTPIGPISVKGTEYSLQYSGTVQFDIGPTASLIRKFSRFVSPKFVGPGIVTTSGLTTAGYVVGAIGLAALIQGSIIYGIKWSKEEGIRKCQVIAERDGYASRVALEISRAGSITELKERIHEWKKFEDKSVGSFAMNAFDKATEQIKSLKKDQYDQTISELKSKYAVKSDGSDDDIFTSVRERIFLKLGGDDLVHNDLVLSML